MKSEFASGMGLCIRELRKIAVALNASLDYLVYNEQLINDTDMETKAAAIISKIIDYYELTETEVDGMFLSVCNYAKQARDRRNNQR